MNVRYDMFILSKTEEIMWIHYSLPVWQVLAKKYKQKLCNFALFWRVFFFFFWNYNWSQKKIWLNWLL